ncbi:MAG TPA: hypothetical protein VER14_02240 [Phototrophicaceae bacterium]|nr:hypothetical protein [Phototrophicaceae bacterium]
MPSSIAKSSSEYNCNSSPLEMHDVNSFSPKDDDERCGTCPSLPSLI